MTGEEPKTDSLKNQSENFNENCTVQKNERVIVMNLSDIIKDKDATISRLQSECNEKSDMIFKLMEQHHQINLRKEQIIIDGVDVKNCRRRIGKNNYCRYFKRLCSENNFNCVWKQLARKTQECEELKNNLHIANTNHEAAEQECELAEQLIARILKTLNLEAYDWRTDRNEILTEIKTFEEKYEALKLENQDGYEIVDELDDKIKKLRKNLALEIETNDRYHKALEEIEEYCNKQISLTGDLPFKTTESDILDIINKAKGDN